MTASKKSETLLNTPELALFSIAFHKSQVPSSVTRLEDGLVVAVNDAWCALTGYSRAEALGKTTVALGLWGQAGRRESTLSAVGATQSNLNTLLVETALVTKAGTHRPIQSSLTKFDIGGVAHLFCDFADVRGQQDSSKLLHEKLEFIEKLTSRVPIMLFQFRLRADGTAHFPYVTSGLRRVFNVTAQDLTEDASNAFAAIYPGDVDLIWPQIKASAQAMVPWQQEFRIKTADGATMWLHGDGLPERLPDDSVIWYGSLTDITKRKSEQAELERAREMATEKANALTVAMDNMAQGFLTGDASGKITRYNKRFLDMLDIPEGVMQSIKDGAELIQFQKRRGDFGENFIWVETDARATLERATLQMGPERYMRKTRAGRSLEIRTHLLPDGGVVRTYDDVTHFVEAQAALHTSEARYRSLTELSSDWYWEQDEQFRFVRVDGYQKYADDAGESFIGHCRWDSGARAVTEAQWDEHRRALQAHEVFRNFEMQRQVADGSVRWSSVSGAPIFDAVGEFRGYRGVGRDITEQKKYEDETQRLAFYDTLTGLPNRRLLLDRLAKALATTERSRTRGALLFIDLDNFKDLNDTLGHDVGDQLLEKVANRLVACIRQGDTVSRFGGDEFVVMVKDLHSDVSEAVRQVKTVGEKILDTLNLPFELQGSVHFSTPSIGVTLFSGQHQSVDELLKRADLAMYQAKGAGRNTMRFFDPEMQSAVARRAALELDMRQGLDRGEFALYYHSVMNAKGEVEGVEALLRWLHPQRGRVSPADFIGVAEQTGLILPLGHWVLKTACDQLVVWSQNVRTEGLTMSVNISQRQFRQNEFVADVLGTLRQTGASPHRLKLELTESLLVTDVPEAIAKMSELRAHGVRFALDDFGTGYSSLSYLKRLPLDELKIDQSFIRDVTNDPIDAAIALTVMALGFSLGLAVVAEGVETQGQRDFLARSGCEYFQGYLFGQPVPIEDLKLDSVVPGFASTQSHILI